MNFIQISGNKFEYQILNQENLSSSVPLVVFLHEALGSAAQWKNFPETVCHLGKLPALVYSRLGSGGSDPITASRNLLYLHHEALTVLPNLLKTLNLNHHPLILLGHSDGATIALIYASRFPVLGVISMAGHVLVDAFMMPGLKEAQEAFISGNLEEKLARYHENKTRRLFRKWFDTWTAPWFQNWNLNEDLPRITAPILVIQGEQDRYGSMEQVKRIQTKVSGPCQIEILKNCGHQPHLEQREALLILLESFLLSLTRPS